MVSYQAVTPMGLHSPLYSPCTGHAPSVAGCIIIGCGRRTATNCPSKPSRPALPHVCPHRPCTAAVGPSRVVAWHQQLRHRVGWGPLCRTGASGRSSALMDHQRSCAPSRTSATAPMPHGPMCSPPLQRAGGGGGGDLAPSQIRGGKFRGGQYRGAPWILCGTPRQSPQMCTAGVREIRGEL